MAARVTDLLLERLAAARRAGVAFEDAWPVARGAALAVVDRSDTPEFTAWITALNATMPSWEASFERRPAPRRETALLGLLDEDRVPVPERECARCHAPIPDDRGRSARYCSPACKREVNAESQRLAGLAA